MIIQTKTEPPKHKRHHTTEIKTKQITQNAIYDYTALTNRRENKKKIEGKEKTTQMSASRLHNGSNSHQSPFTRINSRLHTHNLSI